MYAIVNITAIKINCGAYLHASLIKPMIKANHSPTNRPIIVRANNTVNASTIIQPPMQVVRCIDKNQTTVIMQMQYKIK